MITVTIRILLSILLLIGVYSETGKWTTLTMALVMISNELTALVFKLQREARG